VFPDDRLEPVAVALGLGEFEEVPEAAVARVEAETSEFGGEVVPRGRPVDRQGDEGAVEVVHHGAGLLHG